MPIPAVCELIDWEQSAWMLVYELRVLTIMMLLYHIPTCERILRGITKKLPKVTTKARKYNS